MTGRFGPVDADDLVGDASARLLTLGLERRERLAALRLLGLLADHVDADQRLRRHVDDLAGEFGVHQAELRTSLAALIMAEVVEVELDTGDLRLAAPARPSRGGLRLEAFLGNVARSLDAGPPQEASEVGPLAATRRAPSSSGAWARPSTPALPDASPVGADTEGALVEAEPVERARSEGALVEGALVEGALLEDVPVVHLRATAPPQRRHPLRALTAALVAAATALVLAASPEAQQRATTDLTEPAAADRPVEGGERTVTADQSTTLLPATTNAPRTDRATRPTGGAAPDLREAPTVTPSTRVPDPSPATSTVERTEPDGSPGPSPGPGPAPGPGPVVEVPCEPPAPILDVLHLTTQGTEVDGVGGGRVALVRGTVGNPLDEAVVVEAFDVTVALRDGTTATARTSAPVLLAAGQTATWAVEVPVGDGSPRLATAALVRWARADGSPASCTP